MRKKTKKCPACNSTRYNQVEDGSFRCSRCGFINKTKKMFDKYKKEE